MIFDSWWGFEFSQLNPLLPRAFRQHDKKDKNHWNYHWILDVYLNTLNIGLSWLCSFFLQYFSHSPQLSQLVLKFFILEFFFKEMIKPPLIWLTHLTLKTNFWIMLWLMKSNGCVFTRYTIQKFIKKPQSTSMSCY